MDKRANHPFCGPRHGAIIGSYQLGFLTSSGPVERVRWEPCVFISQPWRSHAIAFAVSGWLHRSVLFGVGKDYIKSVGARRHESLVLFCRML